jgi:pheromone receptor transcription factor
MADLSANIVPDEHASPSQDELQQAGNGAGIDRKRSRMSAAGDDDDDDDDKPGRERRKIEIKFIQDKSRRHITFSKRKAGIMKKVRLVAFPLRFTTRRNFTEPTHTHLSLICYLKEDKKIKR